MLTRTPTEKALFKPARSRDSTVTLRWYQEAIAQQSTGHMYNGLRPVIGSATGAGKSYAIVRACEIILDNAAREGKRAAVILMLGYQSLVRQFERSFRDYGFDRKDVSVAWGSKTSKDLAIAKSRVMICMAQTLESRPELLQTFRPTHIICDEAPFTSFRPAAIMVRHLPWILASATFVRPDGGVNWDHYEMVDPISMKELIEEKCLCPLGILSFDGEFRLPRVSGVVDDDGELNAADQEVLVSSLQKQLILDSWLNYSPYHPTFAACYSKEQAREFCKFFDDNGVGAAIVLDHTSTREREKIFEKLRSGEISIVLSVNAISTGTDEPCVAAVMLLRRVGNPASATQWCGRAARIFPGKTHGVIYDFCGTYNKETNDFALTPPAETVWTNIQFKSLDCDRCGAANPRSRKICRNCDHPLAPPAPVDPKQLEISGDLILPDRSEDDAIMDGNGLIPVYGEHLGPLADYRLSIRPQVEPSKANIRRYRSLIKKAFEARLTPLSAVDAYRKEFESNPPIEGLEGAIFGGKRRNVTVGDFACYFQGLVGAGLSGEEIKHWLSAEFGDNAKPFYEEFKRTEQLAPGFWSRNKTVIKESQR